MRHVTYDRPMKTVQQHILDRQSRHPDATGEFSWLLSGITLATKIIQAQVQRAGLIDVLGATGEENVQGEEVQKLDDIANDTLLRCLGYRGNVGILVFEEEAEPRLLRDAAEAGKYIVLFDPLDGSSNIHTTVAIGTIFSVLQRSPGAWRADVMADVLQPGYRQVAAGYVVYGSSTVMVYSCGDGLHMFTLEPSIGAYLLTQEDMKMPAAGRTCSVNEAYYSRFPAATRAYLDWVKTDEAGGYSLRYVGSLVADFHRTLMNGGVFLYPATTDSPNGKLRLLYEANPFAFLAEQAGGKATDGAERILQKQPQSMHERTPSIIGSSAEVDRVLSFRDQDQDGGS